jgi:hypothetical protein
MITPNVSEVDNEGPARGSIADLYDMDGLRDRHREAKQNLRDAQAEGAEPEMVSLLRDEVGMWRNQIVAGRAAYRLEALRDEIMADLAVSEWADRLDEAWVPGSVSDIPDDRS